MKIIQKGKLPEEKKYRGTCRNCNTIFECEKCDGIYKSDQRDGDYREVKCPFCKHSIAIAVNLFKY